MKYIGVDSNKTKEKYKKFIDLTLLKEDDHTKKIILKSSIDNSNNKLEITNGTSSSVVILDCGILS